MYRTPRSTLVPRRREMHVVLRRAGPAAAPAPSDRAEGADDRRGNHPGPVQGAVEIAPARRVAALPAADVGVLDRVDVDGLPIGVLRPGACAPAPDARRGHRLPAFEAAADVPVGRARVR